MVLLQTIVVLWQLQLSNQISNFPKTNRNSRLLGHVNFRTTVLEKKVIIKDLFSDLNITFRILDIYLGFASK